MRDQGLHRNYRHVQFIFFVYIFFTGFFGTRIGDFTEKEGEGINHSTRRKRIKDIFLQNSNLTYKHSRTSTHVYLVEIYWMTLSITSFCARIDDMTSSELRKQDQGETALLRGLPEHSLERLYNIEVALLGYS